jgi:hypothetical protein
MTSVTLPRRSQNLNSIREHRNNQSLNTDDEETNSAIYFHQYSKRNKPTRALSYEESELQSTASNNRFKHLCSRLKRRLSLTKESRTHSQDDTESASERRMVRFKNYKSFSTTTDDRVNEFDWPDFEKVYDSIPPCLINALPGLDDFSIEENKDSPLNTLKSPIDGTDEDSIEQINLFKQCKRGKDYRRNGICQKIDKNQYNSQLDTFIQQLMIEKLMRTWT